MTPRQAKEMQWVPESPPAKNPETSDCENPSSFVECDGPKPKQPTGLSEQEKHRIAYGQEKGSWPALNPASEMQAEFAGSKTWNAEHELRLNK